MRNFELNFQAFSQEKKIVDNKKKNELKKF